MYVPSENRTVGMVYGMVPDEFGGTLEELVLMCFREGGKDKLWA